MKIATWNINSIRARKQRLLDFLNRHQPDFVALQELKCREEDMPVADLSQAGYHTYGAYQKSYNGVAILSKTPLKQIAAGFGNDPTPQDARTLIARTTDLAIICIYAPNGGHSQHRTFATKLAWYQHLTAFLGADASLTHQGILLGDFNIAPTDADTYDPETTEDDLLCTAEEREAFQELLSLGFLDAHDLRPSTGSRFTWWDYRSLGFQKNRGFRIDTMLLGNIWQKRLGSYEVDRDERRPRALPHGEKPSDHAPVLATFS